MSTTTSDLPAHGASFRIAHGRGLYFGTAVAVAVIVFLGFGRTFWAPLAAGSLDLHPAIVVHAILFFGWVLLFLAQTALPLAGRVRAHRALGLAGIALAGMMVFAGILAAIVTVQQGFGGPRPEAVRTSAALSFSGMTLFSTFFALGIASIARPERHKRLMVLATFSILQAAIARIIMLFPAISQPERVTIGAVVVDTLLLGVVLLDARARGRVDPVYAWGLTLIVLVQCGRVVLLRTDAWGDFVAWFAALGA